MGDEKPILTLTPEQEYAKNLLVQKERLGLFLDMGQGKTATTLVALKELGEKGKLRGHVLVVAPTSVAKNSWSDEIDKWRNFENTRYKVIVGLSKKERNETFEKIKNTPHFLIIGDRIVKQTINWFIHHKVPIGALVIDESQIVKNQNTIIFKTLKRVAPFIPIVALLSGTSAPNSIEDIWSQMMLIDGGRRLGRSFSAFRRQYLRPAKVINQTQVVRWQPIPGAEKAIINRIKDIAIWLETDHSKLPQLTIRNHPVSLSDDEYRLYKRLTQERIVKLLAEMTEDEKISEQEQDDLAKADESQVVDRVLEISASSAGVLTGKLAQIANGAILEDEQPDKEERSIVEIHDAKIDKLQELTESLHDRNEPVLIVYWYKADLKTITDRFDDENIPYEIFDSNNNTVVRRWNEGEIPTLLTQASKANFGLNLQGSGCHLIWYALPFFNFAIYKQMNRRLYRHGQKRDVTIHHIIAEDTIDQKMIESLAHKDRQFSRLMNGLSIKQNIKEDNKKTT